jgi:tetratricopeptide (TPR) repeat protein
MKTMILIVLLTLPTTLFAQSDTIANKRNDDNEPLVLEYNYLIKAEQNIKDGSFKQAQININKVLAINSKSAGAYNALGMLKSKIQNYKGAIIDFTKAIQLDRKDMPLNLTTAYSNRGYAKSQSGDRTGAAADLKKAISISSDNAMAMLNMGNIAAQAKKYSEAISYYDKAIAIDPKFGNAYNNRGLAKHMIGIKAGSCEDLHKAYVFGFAAAKQNLEYYCK